MNRRQLLASGGTGMTLGLVGCIDSVYGLAGGTNWSPTVDGSEPTVTPGDEATLTVQAMEVAALQIIESDGDALTIEKNISDAEVSPIPYTQLDSDPPYWLWESRTSVEAAFPLSVAADAEPGEYHYEVRVFAEETLDTESVESFTVTVTER